MQKNNIVSQVNLEHFSIGDDAKQKPERFLGRRGYQVMGYCATNSHGFTQHRLLPLYYEKGFRTHSEGGPDGF